MLAWLVTAALAAPCALEAPETAQQPPLADEVRFLLTIEVDGADVAWLGSVLDAVEARGGKVALIVGEPPTGALGQRVREALAAGHDLVFADELPALTHADQATKAEIRAAKSKATELRGLTGVRPRAYALPAPSRPTQGLANAAGARILLTDLPGQADATQAARLIGYRVPTTLLPAGAWDARCEGSHAVSPFGAGAADRATQALRDTAAAGRPAWMRLGLDGAHPDPADAQALGAWLDAVLAPSQARWLDLDAAHADAQAWLAAPPTRSPWIDASTLRETAAALEGVEAIPGALPGDLTASEATLALADWLVLGGPSRVRLPAIDGPRHPSTSTLEGPVEVPREALIAALTAPYRAGWASVPGVWTLGEHSFTAAEWLVLLASAARGEEPARTAPTAPPNARSFDQGFGDVRPAAP